MNDLRLEIDKTLLKSDELHDDWLEGLAYKIAAEYAKLREDYVLLYIKKRPKWLPEIIYRWILGKVLVLANFRK